MKIEARNKTRCIQIYGHGITVIEPFDLGNSIFIEPVGEELNIHDVKAGTSQFSDYAAVILGYPFANFVLRIEGVSDARSLAIKAWNSLWYFHLLSLAANKPCCCLFSASKGVQPAFNIANRTLITRPFSEVKPVSLS